MEVYQKLALKYRPKVLDDIFGQDTIVTQLKGMFKTGRISNVFLLHGPYGCGKTTIGRIIWRYVNCTDFNKEKCEPCGKCNTCTSEYSQDLIEVDGGSQGGIDKVRSLQQQATLCPQGKYKIYLIDEVQGFSRNAWDASLRLLEDTPKETIFILCTTDPGKIPDEIISRCIRFDILPVKEEDCIALLGYICAQEGLDEKIYTEKLFKDITSFTKCYPRTALNTLETVRNYIDGAGKTIDIKNIVNEIREKVLIAPEWQLALKYLLSIYRGKYTGALRVVNAITNFDGFMRLLMEYHTQTIYRTVSEKLMNPYSYQWYYDELEKYNIKNDIDFTMKLSETAEIFTKLAGDIKQYLIDAKYLLIATTMKLTTLFSEKI